MRKMAAVAMVAMLPMTAAAQADSTRVFDAQHPLVYEDAWDLWPYAFLNDNGEPDGYNIDLLRMIFKRLDIPFIIKLKPTSESLKDLKAGKADLMLGMDAGFHDEFGSYGKSVISLFTHSVVHQKDVEPKVKTMKDLTDHRVIVHEGAFSHHLMIDNGWGDNAEGYNDMKEAIQKASVDPESEIVWNTMSLKWLINKYQTKNLELSPIDIPHGEYKFMSNNRHLLAQLDSVYAMILAEERLTPIQNKWFYPERTETGIPSWVWQLAIVLAVLALGPLLYFFFYHLREKQLTKDLRHQNSRLALILKTSKVHFWTYDTSNKLFTKMDDNGNPVRTSTLLEFSQYYPKDSFETLINGMNRVLRQEVDQLTLELKGKAEIDSEELREYNISIAVLRRQKNGHPSVLIGTRSDITEERRMEHEAKNMMLRYQAIFSSSMIEMVYFDANGYIEDFNEKAGKTFGITHERLEKHPISIQDTMQIHDLDLAHFEEMYVTRLFDMRRAKKHIQDAVEFKGRMYYEMKLVPVYDQQDKLMGIYFSGRNVTEVANTYMRQQENLRQITKANEELTEYITNINYALKVGDVRIANYSSDTHILSIFSNIGQTAYELTQARALTLASDTDRNAAQRVFNIMDNRTVNPISTTVESTIRLKNGYPLVLDIHFVPVIGDDGIVHEYFGMIRDVSEMKHTEAELAKETIKAQEVEMVKNAFLRNMSYEIRTPLNTVVGFAELFQGEHSSDDEAVFIEQIKDNSRQLLTLINDILFLSRLDAQMIEIKPQFTDFAKMFNSICVTTWDHLRQPGVYYTIENPYEQLVIDIDAQNVSVIIEQIVANACQNTMSGTVRARIDYIGDQLIMAVDDTGCGIPEQRLSTIFERFATGANMGSGLGLSICHELTQRMGGSINIKSTEGKGTTVWVTLPCRSSEIIRK